ncbi:MAG: serpin family protein [Lachnospiraceae bacterium]|nr:serpin family protein [Lachnospiraceae bacterium]
MKKRKRWVIILGVLLGLSACGQRNGSGEAAERLNAAIEIKVPEDKGSFRREPEPDMTAFATELTAAYLQARSGDRGNALLSPVSARFAFATLAEGAGEQTRTELLRFLQAKDADSFRKSNTFLKALLNSGGMEEERIVVRDSIWLDQRFTSVSPDFLERAACDHFAEIYRGDLKQTQVTEQMSAWVDKATGGLIKPEIKPYDERIMTIMNTLYLKGSWERKFNEATNSRGEFLTADGAVTATFMHQLTEADSYGEAEDYRLAALKLKNGCRYKVLLPKPGVSLDRLLSGEKGKDTIRALLTAKLDQPARIKWAVPQYQSETELDLKTVMTDMGYGGLYSKQANYRGMIQEQAATAEMPYLDSARHLTKLIVNNEGIEAAAYTELEIKSELAPSPEEGALIEMKLDQPYLYLIETDGAPLLIGTVQNPTQE